MTEAPWTTPPHDPTAIARPPRQHRHVWERVVERKAIDIGVPDAAVELSFWRCSRCGVVRDETQARRGKQSRNYGTRAELAIAKQYGGTKIGHAGGPVDIRGEVFNTQVKTHRRKPPAEWTKAFAAMAASRDRLPRLFLRFVGIPGQPPIDFIIVPGEVWLEWYGRDEAKEEPS